MKRSDHWNISEWAFIIFVCHNHIKKSQEKLFLWKHWFFFPLLKIVLPSKSTYKRTFVIRSFSCIQLVSKPCPCLSAIFYWLYHCQVKSLKGVGITTIWELGNFSDVGNASCKGYPKTNFKNQQAFFGNKTGTKTDKEV